MPRAEVIVDTVVAGPSAGPALPVATGRREQAIALGVFFLAYGLAQVGSDTFSTPDGVSVWFPPAAMTFALLALVQGPIGVAGVVATRIFWSVATGATASWWLTVTNAVVVATAYWLAVHLARRWTRPEEQTSPGPHAIAVFLLTGGIVGPALAALGTRTVSAILGRTSWDAVIEVAASFWIGDALAVVTLVPLLWAGWVLATKGRSRREGLELVGGVLGTAAVAWAVLRLPAPVDTPLYLIVPPVVVLAIRHALVGAALGTGAASLAITAAFSRGFDQAVTVADGHVFLIVLATVGLTVGAVELTRRQGAAALSVSEERYRKMVQSVEDYAIYLLDADGRIATWNDGATRLTGLTAAEAIGRPLEVLHTPPDRARDLAGTLLERARREGHADDEGWRLGPDGSRFWAQVTLNRLRDDAGEVRGYVKVTRDITERRRAEVTLEHQARELARSNEELDRFASVASHDLQEPLRMVSSYTELLARRYGDRLDDDARELIGYAVDGARRMRELINDLLEYSRLHTRPGAVHTVDLGKVAEAACRELRLAVEEAEATIEIGELPEVQGEPLHLQMLFQNLIGNALKYRGDAPPWVAVTAEPSPDGGWTVSVEDNGIGVPATYATAIFEPFRRLHARSEYPGTGIGLAICRRVVDRHGGRIWVEPLPSGGSVFRFSFPPPGWEREESFHDW